LHDGRHAAAISVGYNPVFGGQQIVVEAYILDFGEDLRGQEIGLELRSQGIGILLWCWLVVVFVADYILRPKLVGTKIRMNDLLVFIAIFGGIEAFGILGLVLGPIAVAILLSLIRIYQDEYRPEGPPRATDVTVPPEERAQLDHH